MKFESIRDMSKQDSDIKQILKGEIFKSNQYFCFHNEHSVVYGVFMRGLRIVIPSKLIRQTIDQGHEGHQGIVKTTARLRGKL